MSFEFGLPYNWAPAEDTLCDRPPVWNRALWITPLSSTEWYFAFQQNYSVLNTPNMAGKAANPGGSQAPLTGLPVTHKLLHGCYSNREESC